MEFTLSNLYSSIVFVRILRNQNNGNLRKKRINNKGICWLPQLRSSSGRYAANTQQRDDSLCGENVTEEYSTS